MNTARQNLVAILREILAWLSRPENDFAWSSWNGATAACEEVSALIAQLEVAEQLPEKASLSILFAPTGPIQEVSLSSRWGAEFLELSSRFDAALDELYR